MKNVKVLGSGLIAGGFYEDIKITGSSKVDGELYCENINVLGRVNALGKTVVQNKVSVSGSANLNGNLEALGIDINGKLTCRGHIECDDLIITGSANLLTASATNMNVCGGCTAQEINVEKLHLDSRKFNVEKIYANTVTIKPKGLKIPFKENKAIIKYLECDTIDADVLVCEKIYGKDVKLGSDCEVDYIEYSGTIDIHPKAKIKEVVKIY